jgi:hypothetical protein
MYPELGIILDMNSLLIVLRWNECSSGILLLLWTIQKRLFGRIFRVAG